MPSCPRMHQSRGDTWGEGKAGARRLTWGTAGFGGAATLQRLDRHGQQTQRHRTRRPTRCWDECCEPRGHLGLKREMGTQKRNSWWVGWKDTCPPPPGGEQGSWGQGVLAADLVRAGGTGWKAEDAGKLTEWAWVRGWWLAGPRAGSGRWVRACLCDSAGGCGSVVGESVQGSGTPREQGGWGSLRPPAGLGTRSPALPDRGETTLLSVAGTGLRSFSFFLSFFFLKVFKKHLFIWLYWVLVAACRIFS